MKKFPKIFFVFIMLLLSKSATAQTLPSACTAVSLNPITSPIQSRTPQKVRGIAVCNMLPADTSVWWSFRPSGTTFNFSWATTGCTCATGGIAGADVVVYKGTSCSALTKIQCKNGVSGTYALSNLSPCTLYWIQVGSTNTCQCNVTLTYNVSQLLRSIEPVKITGPQVVCKGATIIYTATSELSCLNTNVFRWAIAQGIAQYTDLDNGKVQVTFPKGGKYRITVEPNFASSQPYFTKNYIDIEVIDLKEASESLKLCPEDNGYSVDLKSIIKKTNPTFNREVVPSNYEVKEVAGTKKTIVIPYEVIGTGCTQNVNLSIDIPLIKKVTLPSRILTDGEKLNIKSNDFSCADVRAYPINFVKSGGSGKCDSTFTISLQCMKVTPSIYPKAAFLDCVNKTITLDASKSSTLPAALAVGNGNTGIRSYLWSNGATTSKISIAQAGNYSVTVTYTYKWLSPTGAVSRTISKTTSATVIGSINNKPQTPLPKTASLSPCVGDTTLYYQPKIPNVSYTWSVTNGKILGAQVADSVRVVWNNQNPKRLCSRLNASCGIGNDTCMAIQTSTVIPSKAKVVLNQCIATNIFKFAVQSQANVTHHWVAKNGSLSKSIGDTVIVTWTAISGRSLCVTSVADCTVSADTCVVHGSNLIASPSASKIGKSLSQNIFDVKILPNPARESIEIVSNRTIEEFLIFDLTGQLILRSTESNIDINELKAGLYILKSIDNAKEVKVLNFIKI
jgi:hypothetical protein